MRPCRELRETLLLDVYEELPTEALSMWARHLKACPECREERHRLLLLLQRVREAMPPPAPSQETLQALQCDITRRLNGERAKRAWYGRPWGIRVRPLHALAATSLLVIVLGWFGLREMHRPFSLKTATNPEVEERTVAQNLDVIDNMDLLEDMDILQKLVKVVDHRDSKL